MENNGHLRKKLDRVNYLNKKRILQKHICYICTASTFLQFYTF